MLFRLFVYRMAFSDWKDKFELVELCFMGPGSLTEVLENEERIKFDGKLFDGSWRSGVNAGGKTENDCKL